MKENTLELSFEMYEELKETLIKTLRTELAEARSQPVATIDTDAINPSVTGLPAPSVAHWTR